MKTLETAKAGDVIEVEIVSTAAPRVRTFTLTRDPEAWENGKYRIFHNENYRATYYRGAYTLEVPVVVRDVDLDEVDRIRQRIVEELRCSLYEKTAAYALRDFGNSPYFTAAINAAIAAKEVYISEARSDTTRFGPNIEVPFYAAVGWYRGEHSACGAAHRVWQDCP